MKYKNAKDIFPESLLRQIQRYVSGEVIYIPAGKEKRVWGETSGYQKYLRVRNRDIRADFSNGADFDSLVSKYNLSYETIRKIVYQKKEDIILDYETSLSSAKAYAEAGKIDEWIHAYLKTDGHNVPFSDGLKLYDRYYFAPIIMPAKFFVRCCGPEENMKYRIEQTWFDKHVKELEAVIKSNSDMPPLIAHYVEHEFELNDGNHRLEAYKNLGITEIPVIIWITEESEYEEFCDKYKEYAEGIKVIRR